jgi:hypothetical protein
MSAPRQLTLFVGPWGRQVHRPFCNPPQTPQSILLHPDVQREKDETDDHFGMGVATPPDFATYKTKKRALKKYGEVPRGTRPITLSMLEISDEAVGHTSSSESRGSGPVVSIQSTTTKKRQPSLPAQQLDDEPGAGVADEEEEENENENENENAASSSTSRRELPVAAHEALGEPTLRSSMQLSSAAVDGSNDVAGEARESHLDVNNGGSKSKAAMPLFCPLGCRQSSEAAVMQMETWALIIERESILQMVTESTRVLTKMFGKLVDKKLTAATCEVKFLPVPTDVASGIQKSRENIEAEQRRLSSLLANLQASTLRSAEAILRWRRSEQSSEEDLPSRPLFDDYMEKMATDTARALDGGSERQEGLSCVLAWLGDSGGGGGGGGGGGDMVSNNPLLLVKPRGRNLLREVRDAHEAKVAAIERRREVHNLQRKSVFLSQTSTQGAGLHAQLAAMHEKMQSLQDDEFQENDDEDEEEEEDDDSDEDEDDNINDGDDAAMDYRRSLPRDSKSLSKGSSKDGLPSIMRHGNDELTRVQYELATLPECPTFQIFPRGPVDDDGDDDWWTHVATVERAILNQGRAIVARESGETQQPASDSKPHDERKKSKRRLLRPKVTIFASSGGSSKHDQDVFSLSRDAVGTAPVAAAPSSEKGRLQQEQPTPEARRFAESAMLLAEGRLEQIRGERRAARSAEKTGVHTAPQFVESAMSLAHGRVERLRLVKESAAASVASAIANLAAVLSLKKERMVVVRVVAQPTSTQSSAEEEDRTAVLDVPETLEVASTGGDDGVTQNEKSTAALLSFSPPAPTSAVSHVPTVSGMIRYESAISSSTFHDYRKILGIEEAQSRQPSFDDDSSRLGGVLEEFTLMSFLDSSSNRNGVDEDTVRSKSTARLGQVRLAVEKARLARDVRTLEDSKASEDPGKWTALPVNRGTPAASVRKKRAAALSAANSSNNNNDDDDDDRGPSLRQTRPRQPPSSRTRGGASAAAASRNKSRRLVERRVDPITEERAAATLSGAIGAAPIAVRLRAGARPGK